ncbi:hypothetical protein B0H66DRAFT_232864 [Apodospora peruviana]|uniref:Bul1 C-terminal domain-containing protein n=1 Tax=Apodospora peruviana TaxID=516989 RepID=A0AAE0I4U6_9PEZI|nr:hypothetical protein B0H66DRAFT_232864 [Apodospora peruviana]
MAYTNRNPYSGPYASIVAPHRPSLAATMSSNASTSRSEASDPNDALLVNANKKLPYPKSDIKVNLENHFRSKVYTSGSPITGNLTITTKRDVRFDTIQILLVGSSRTRVESGLHAPQDVTHTLLKVAMPIPESSYPVPRVLETGHTYTFPFNFVIPNHLTINACNHPTLGGRLQDQHVLLPPTMGRWEKDDMSPQMAQIEYSIKGRVLHQPDLGRTKLRIMEATQTIHVLPASVEEPPLNVTDNDRLYHMSGSKSIRKTVLSTKVGRLTAEGSQPPPALLRFDGVGMLSPATAQINLKFEPTSVDVAPPKVTGISGKVTAHTFFSSGAIGSFPNLGDWSEQFISDKRGIYSTSAALPPISVSHARWQQHITASARRDSGYSSDHNTADTDSGTPPAAAPSNSSRSSRRRTTQQQNGKSKKKQNGSPIFQTTTQQLSFSLPMDKKTFIPTFHSCIISRVYTLQLALTVAVGSATRTITLVLPLQVMVDSNLQHDLGTAGLPSFETAVQEAEADEHLRPRVLQVPDQQFRETAMLPGYSG